MTLRTIELAVTLTERPTTPRPKITTVDPLDMSATFQAAPRPTSMSIVTTTLTMRSIVIHIVSASKKLENDKTKHDSKYMNLKLDHNNRIT